MSATTDYTFRLDDAEIERFRAMAANAERHESDLWALAGIGAGASVIDLGCGPGALLPRFAERVGPTGTIVALDADEDACGRARRLAEGLDATVRVVQADATATGLPPGEADVVVVRNVLVHNGPRTRAILASAAALLRPGGRLLSAEPDVAGLDFGPAEAEREYERRWAAMMQADGSDPALGSGDRLPRLLTECGWTVVDDRHWTDRLVIDKSPAWAAAEVIVSRGFATADEIAGWLEALEQRRQSGPLRCSLGMHAVVAEVGDLGRS